jgi:hypothetical protein
MRDTQEITEPDAALDIEGNAYSTSGFKAAVFKPMFGNAHQQYFTPRWLCEALPPIAEHAFGFEALTPEERPRLNVIDPTAGSGRLLVPFKERGHHVFGVELDARLAEIAGKAVGRRAVRQGDVMAYGPLIPESRWQVAAVNPPYGLWWPVPEASPYERYELASDRNVESQHLVLELVTNLLAYNNGLLIAILSGKFFDNYPRVAAFLQKHYQVVANVILPQPFRAEYGIEVDAAFVVAVTDSPYNTRKKLAPLTGPFEGNGPMLVRAVNAAFDEVKRNPSYRAWQTAGPGNPPVFHLHAPFHQDKPPRVPDLDMAVQVDTSSLPLNLTARGLSARRDEPGNRTDRSGNPANWAAAWFRLYNALPLQAYDAAQGTYAPLGEAYGSLPNVLISGVGESCDRLTELGFDVALTAHDAEQIELRARRFARDRLPVRELEPLEYLAYYADGPIVAKATATLPDGTAIPAGAAYELRSRWFRRDEEVGAGEEKGSGKKLYVQHTFVDRGYLVLRFTPATPTHEGVELKPFTVEEVNPDQVKALVDAFGLPQVPTVDDLPALQGWVNRLNRFMDGHETRANGRRLYPTQAQDVVRMACKSSVALLYEQGGGKTTTMAHWAALRGYRTAVIVTPASVVPGIVEDLANWGFPVQRLEHATISRLFEEKRRHKLARQRVRTAFGRARRLRGRMSELLALRNGQMVELAKEWGLPDGPHALKDLDQVVKEKVQALETRLQGEEAILAAEDRRQHLEAELARKRRHLRNLVAIHDKGKARDPQGIEAEIGEAESQVQTLTGQVKAAYAVLDDVYHDPCRPLPDFYVASYQDLSLGDHVGIFDPWSHDHFDRQGNYEGTVNGLRGAKCTCDAGRKGQVPDCPRCGTPWRGEGDGGGRVCRSCGFVAWTMGRTPKQVLPTVNPKAPKLEQVHARRQRIAVLKEQNLNARAFTRAGDDVFQSTYHQWPMGNRAKTLFSCVMLDEAQDAKSKLSLRGAAARGLRANGKAILTGTWIKGYCIDLFWTAGWLLGFGSPLWPFPYRGGSARFLQQFGTYQFVTKEYADTLVVGRRKLIPSVSNLNRLWKLLSPVSIRRLKEDFLTDLPPKQRHIHWLPPTGKHDLLVGHVTGAMKDVFERELRKADPNMGAISAALWWGRYVASCPNEHGALHFAGAWGHTVNVDELSPAEARAILDQLRLQGAYLVPKAGLAVAYGFNKVEKALEIVEEIKAAGEKVIVFTSLRGLYRTLEAAFKDRFIGYVGIDGVSTQKRNEVVRRFEASDATVLLAGTGTLNRGVTVNGANHVLILNLEWSPETTLQAEDRCHRPGQTREVHVHYLLSSHTVDEQMWDLVDQKWAAQRAVQDREAQHKTVEAILAEAALANAQLAVAKAVLKAEFRREGATAEEASAKAEKAVEKIATQLVFGRAPAQRTAMRRRGKPDVKVVYFRSLLDAEEEDGMVILAPSQEPVQLAMFTW